MSHVWAVHITLANEVRPTEAIFTTEREASAHAATLSQDTGVLAASVVRFVLGEVGSRRGVAMFVAGKRQQVPYVSDCRTVFSGGRKYS